jgi:hypothetical protein
MGNIVLLSLKTRIIACLLRANQARESHPRLRCIEMKLLEGVKAKHAETRCPVIHLQFYSFRNKN